MILLLYVWKKKIFFEVFTSLRQYFSTFHTSSTNLNAWINSGQYQVLVFVINLLQPTKSVNWRENKAFGSSCFKIYSLKIIRGICHFRFYLLFKNTLSIYIHKIRKQLVLEFTSIVYLYLFYFILLYHFFGFQWVYLNLYLLNE